jgi:hypothetical protein
MTEARPEITIALPNFLLTSFAGFIHVFVSLNVVPSSFEKLDFILLYNSIDYVACLFAVADTMIEDLNFMLPD